MPPRQIIKYAVDTALVVAPLSGVLYFLFDPDAFNAFLDWLMRML
jgi:Flp pilus assembly protein TadG